MKSQFVGLFAGLGLATRPPPNLRVPPNSPCNPMGLLNIPCPAMRGLDEPGTVTFDFARDGEPAETTAGWRSLANPSRVLWTKDGAEFASAEPQKFPAIEMDSYIWYGRVDVEMKAAKGKGALNAISILSDTGDEINWQISGSELAKPKSGYVGRGARGPWQDHLPNSTSAHDNEPKFHTYSIDWKKDRILWEIDNKVQRTLTLNSTSRGPFFPQAPSRVRIAVVPGAAAKNATTGLRDAPWKMNVRKVAVKNDYVSKYYEIVDRFQAVDGLQPLYRNPSDPQVYGKTRRILEGVPRRDQDGDQDPGLDVVLERFRTLREPFYVHGFDADDGQLKPERPKLRFGGKRSLRFARFAPTGIHEFDSPSELFSPHHQHLKAPLVSSSVAAGLAAQSALAPLLLILHYVVWA